MRIGIDTLFESPYGGSGGQFTLINFVKTLASLPGEHEFYLFVSQSNKHLYECQVSHIHHIVYPYSNERRILRILEQQVLIPYHCCQLNLDVLNSPGNYGTLFAPCPVVLKIQTNQHLHRPQDIGRLRAILRSVFIPMSARKSSAIIVNSESLKREVLQHTAIPADKIYVVYDAIDVSFFHSALAEPPLEARERLSAYGVKGPYILFVSSLWPYKNAGGLIKAFANLLAAKNMDHDLVIVGSGPIAYVGSLKQMTQDLGIDDRVIFIGRVEDRQTMRDFYRGADVFVYPSFSETFGLPPLEAMACGTPVVASNRTSVPEVVRDAGLLVDPSDVEAMADAIYKVISDTALREDLIKRGILRCQLFSPERMVKETIKVFESVVR